jgi:cation transport regulator ChaB
MICRQASAGICRSTPKDIYRNAFNHAWDKYSIEEPERCERIAHRIAWAAVKRCYEKLGTHWVERPAHAWR